MGNASKKLNEKDLDLLKNTETSTGMDKKALLKEYKKFKKQFPTGGINKEQFRYVSPWVCFGHFFPFRICSGLVVFRFEADAFDFSTIAKWQVPFYHRSNALRSLSVRGVAFVQIRVCLTGSPLPSSLPLPSSRTDRLFNAFGTLKNISVLVSAKLLR